MSLSLAALVELGENIPTSFLLLNFSLITSSSFLEIIIGNKNTYFRVVCWQLICSLRRIVKF